MGLEWEAAGLGREKNICALSVLEPLICSFHELGGISLFVGEEMRDERDLLKRKVKMDLWCQA